MSGELPLVPNASTIRTATEEESGGRTWLVRKILLLLYFNLEAASCIYWDANSDLNDLRAF